MRVHFPENNIYFVTNRCLQERFFFLPKPGIVKIIGAWLAKALKEYGDGIELYGFIFLSSHFHFLLRDTKGQLAQFMWYFQLNVGKAISRELGRRGYFFSREYDAAPVLTNEDFEDRYAYLLTNAVKAGLVAKAGQAPFFSSLEAALENKTLRFVWLDRTKKHNKSRRGQKVKDASFEEVNEIALAIPPMWKELTSRKRKARIEALIKANEVRYGKQRRAERCEQARTATQRASSRDRPPVAVAVAFAVQRQLPLPAFEDRPGREPNLAQRSEESIAGREE